MEIIRKIVKVARENIFSIWFALSFGAMFVQLFVPYFRQSALMVVVWQSIALLSCVLCIVFSWKKEKANGYRGFV